MLKPLPSLHPLLRERESPFGDATLKQHPLLTHRSISPSGDALLKLGSGCIPERSPFGDAALKQHPLLTHRSISPFGDAMLKLLPLLTQGESQFGGATLKLLPLLTQGEGQFGGATLKLLPLLTHRVGPFGTPKLARPKTMRSKPLHDEKILRLLHRTTTTAISAARLHHLLPSIQNTRRTLDHSQVIHTPATLAV